VKTQPKQRQTIPSS